MLEHGFLNEVSVLMQRPGFSRDLPSMRAVGYRQAIAFLNGESDVGLMRERALASTRQLAKHQMTWLRSTLTQASIDALAGDVKEQFIEIATRALAS
jgi:tRNA dimethylallyltransferase